MANSKWIPKDSDAFIAAYKGGATNPELAAQFGGSCAATKHHINCLVEDGKINRRDGRSGAVHSKKTDDTSLIIVQRLRSANVAVDIIDLANDLDVSPKRIETEIEDLAAQGYLVSVERGHARFSPPEIGRKSHRYAEYLDNSRTFTFAIASDAHLCSKYARLDHLNTFFDICEAEGITTVYDAGNQIDGEARFNKSDLEVHGMGNQINYWAENWPKRKGIHTHYICGDDHEGWYLQRESLDIGWHMEQVAKNKYGRDDLHYLGYMEHDVVYETPEGGKTVLRVQHPGGGTAYATSYQPQKIVESLSGGEKPNILLLGHYHKQGNFLVRNVHTLLTGCFQDQTPFMRKKRLAAHVGGYLVKVTQAPDGSVLRFNSTFIPFYGDTFNEVWSYKFD